MNTAIPDAASSFQRSSQTRRDASTTSNGAGSNAMAREAIGPPSAERSATGERSADDACGLERFDVGDRQSEAEQELVVVLAEQRSAARRW